MRAITFRTVVDGDQVIRPPAHVCLPQGALEVTVRLLGEETPIEQAPREAANARLRQHRVRLGYATGTDNEAIDADLARGYGDNPKAG